MHVETHRVNGADVFVVYGISVRVSAVICGVNWWSKLEGDLMGGVAPALV
jgi:hypothetical protein